MSIALKHPLAAFVAVLIALPLIPGMPLFWIDLLDNIGMAAIVTIGLVLLTGVGRLTSFGQAAFCGISAYATAVLTTRYGWSPFASLPVALLVSALAAYVLGLITVRLSGHYLPLGTIAWGISLFYLFGNFEFLGSHDGISGIPPLALGTFKLLDPRAIYYVIWLCVVVVAFLTNNLLDSRIGRAIRVLRTSRVAAEAFGVDPAAVKLLVFVYAAVLAGLSGWLYAHDQRAVNPTPFGIDAGIAYLFMAVVGGGGFVWGGVLGAAFVSMLKDALQHVIPALTGSSGQYETIAFGLVLVGLLQIAPGGLWPRLMQWIPAKPPRPMPVPAADLQHHVPSAVAGQELLRLEHLRKQFAGLVAVNDVSFCVDSGQIVALIGPNGAGKSTTFNLVTAISGATSGKIWLRGARIDTCSPQQIAALGVARTFQHVNLMADMSVLENVALGAHLRGTAGPLASMLRLDRAQEARLLTEAARQIARVGLTEHLHKPAGSLALGQQRMVEIARALCNDPALLLLDEPAAGLRLFEKQALSALLRQLQAEGMAVLLVEHDMGFVMGLADHVVVLEFGTLIAAGPPDTIRTNARVIAAYLGDE